MLSKSLIHVVFSSWMSKPLFNKQTTFYKRMLIDFLMKIILVESQLRGKKTSYVSSDDKITKKTFHPLVIKSVCSCPIDYVQAVVYSLITNHPINPSDL